MTPLSFNWQSSLLLYVYFANAAGRNFVRGALLGVAATCTGLVVFGFPEALYKLTGIVLPISEKLAVSLKVTGAAIANWIMTSYFY